MNLTANGANDMITRLVRDVELLTYAQGISLHTADPGSSGANEVTGGSYLRTSLSFSAAASGSITNSSAMNIAGMPACTVTYLGFWTADNVFLAKAEFNEAVDVGTGETFHIDAGNLVISLAEDNGSDALGNFVLDRFARAFNFTTAPVSVSLHTGSPGSGGTANEVTDPGYERTVVPADSWATAAASEISNSADVDFPNLTPKTITHFGVWSEAGVYLLTITADPAIVLTLPSQTLRIPPGLLTIRVTEAEFAGWNGWTNRNGPATSFNSYPTISDGLTRIYFGIRAGATGNNRFRSLLKSDLTTYATYTTPANHLGIGSVLAMGDGSTVFVGTLDSGGAVAYKFVQPSTFTNITWPGASSDGINMLAKHPTDANIVYIANQATSGAGSVRLYAFSISGGTWTKIGGDGLNSSWNVSSTNKSCSSVAFLGTEIFAMITGGTANQLDVYAAPIATYSPWTKIAGGGTNGSWATGTKRNGALAVVNGKLYAAIGGSTAGDAEVWRFDGATWTQIGGDSLNSSWATGTKTNASRIAYRGNRVVVGLVGTASGDAEVWQYNLSSGFWTQIGGDGINSSWSGLTQVNSIHVDREGILWASPSNNSTGTPLFYSNHPL